MSWRIGSCPHRTTDLGVHRSLKDLITKLFWMTFTSIWMNTETGSCSRTASLKKFSGHHNLNRWLKSELQSNSLWAAKNVCYNNPIFVVTCHLGPKAKQYIVRYKYELIRTVIVIDEFNCNSYQFCQQLWPSYLGMSCWFWT